MSYIKTIEEITKNIYRGVQLPSDYQKTRQAGPNDRHVVRLLTATSISEKIYGTTEGIIDNFDGLERLKDNQSYNRYYLEDGDLAITARGKSIRIALIRIKHDELIIPNGSVIIVRNKVPEDAAPSLPYNEVNFYRNQTFAYLSHLLHSAGENSSDVNSGLFKSPLFVGNLKKITVPFLDNPVHNGIMVHNFMENIEKRTRLLGELRRLDESLPKFDFVTPETLEDRETRMEAIQKITQEDQLL